MFVYSLLFNAYILFLFYYYICRWAVGGITCKKTLIAPGLVPQPEVPGSPPSKAAPAAPAAQAKAKAPRKMLDDWGKKWVT